MVAEITIYKSGESYLLTDGNVFEKMYNKYGFDVETEERDKVYSQTLEEFLDAEYEQEYYDVLGYSGSYAEFSEDVANMESMFDGTEDWLKMVDELMKISVSTNVFGYKMENELKGLQEQGFDLDILKLTLDGIINSKSAFHQKSRREYNGKIFSR